MHRQHWGTRGVGVTHDIAAPNCKGRLLLLGKNPTTREESDRYYTRILPTREESDRYYTRILNTREESDRLLYKNPTYKTRTLHRGRGGEQFKG